MMRAIFRTRALVLKFDKYFFLLKRNLTNYLPTSSKWKFSQSIPKTFFHKPCNFYLNKTLSIKLLFIFHRCAAKWVLYQTRVPCSSSNTTRTYCRLSRRTSPLRASATWADSARTCTTHTTSSLSRRSSLTTNQLSELIFFVLPGIVIWFDFE